MNRIVEKEVKQLIEELKLNCTIKEFKEEVGWYGVSHCQKLSEKFIKEFKDKVYWGYISEYQKLSESFIRKFKDKVNWYNISQYQKLSEKFIKEFKDKVNWYCISKSQILSEEFIREFKDEVEWENISRSQKLSEEFIKEFKNEVHWLRIFQCQILSKSFIKEFKDKIDKIIYNRIHRTISYKQKIKEVKLYCKKHQLEFDYKNRCFYPYRNHDQQGKGSFNKTISYKKGKYYKDWHLDMRKDVEDSFGLGIWPKGNTQVKVMIKDWGVPVSREDGKCRVWGFEIV
ncbi:MAG: hypothetical protein J7L15_00810 [Clostridiales bacterium]|nr:hypothetical protein [Clostridiales bacterium]